MKALNLAIVFVVSIACFLMIAPLRGKYLIGDSFYGGFHLSTLCGFAAFFYLTFFFLTYYNKKLTPFLIVFTIFAGHWILEAPIRFLNFSSTLISLPDSMTHTLGIFCGFLYWRLKSPFDLLPVLAGSLLVVFMYFQGYDYWLHRLNFETFTGEVAASNLPAKFEAYDENHKLISSGDFANKVVLLDFWHTRCGICFQKFPYLQEFYLRNQGRKDILAIAVNKPIPEDKPGDAFRMIKEEEGYSFPVAVTKEEDMAEKFGVKGYPTTFVIDKQGMVVFKGDIEGAIRIAEDLLK